MFRGAGAPDACGSDTSIRPAATLLTAVMFAFVNSSLQMRITDSALSVPTRRSATYFTGAINIGEFVKHPHVAPKTRPTHS